jgi:hypothetical protein
MVVAFANAARHGTIHLRSSAKASVCLGDPIASFGVAGEVEIIRVATVVIATDVADAGA